MLAVLVPLAAHVPAAVPVVFTINNEAAIVFAVARGAAPLATTIVTVMESAALTKGPPPTVFAAVMLVVVSEAGLTEVAVRELETGQELHESPAGGVPVSDTEIV